MTRYLAVVLVYTRPLDASAPRSEAVTRGACVCVVLHIGAYAVATLTARCVV